MTAGVYDRKLYAFLHISKLIVASNLKSIAGLSLPIMVLVRHVWVMLLSRLACLVLQPVPRNSRRSEKEAKSNQYAQKKTSKNLTLQIKHFICESRSQHHLPRETLLHQIDVPRCLPCPYASPDLVL